jgi:hypothetical protein
MKKALALAIILATFASCGTYTLLTKEKYDIVYRDGNQTKIKAYFRALKQAGTWNQSRTD